MTHVQKVFLAETKNVPWELYVGTDERSELLAAVLTSRSKAAYHEKLLRAANMEALEADKKLFDFDGKKVN